MIIIKYVLEFMVSTFLCHNIEYSHDLKYKNSGQAVLLCII